MTAVTLNIIITVGALAQLVGGLVTLRLAFIGRAERPVRTRCYATKLHAMANAFSPDQAPVDSHGGV